MSETLRLADAACERVDRAGAKAARLAQALRAGLPVPPGIVVPAEDSVPVLAAAAARIAREGVHAARFAVMASRSPAEERWRSAAGPLGENLVVRSSSPWEHDALFAGALASVLGVCAAEVPTAVRSVWASALDEDVAARLAAREQEAEGLAVAVLIQPQLDPDLAGTARWEADGSVTVVFVPGSAAALMAGWDPGHTVRIGSDGRPTDGAGPADDRLAAAAVARLAGAVHERWGDDLIEWAQCGGQVSLLQARRAAPRAATGPSPVPLDEPTALAVARLVWRFAGPFGERCVLPWAAAVPDLDRWLATPAGEPDRPAALCERLAGLADLLTAQSWQQPAEAARAQAQATWRAVRGPDAAPALRRLATLRTPDPEVVGEFGRLAGALARAATGAPEARPQLWACTGEELAAAESSTLTFPRAAAALGRARRRWEPFVHAAVAGLGEQRTGTPAVAGTAAGLALTVDPGTTAREVVGRPVLLADRPWPRLASLLYGAAGLVTVGGSPAAHLVEVAASLGVPTVVGCDVTDLLGPGALLAVDGGRGVVAVAAP